MFKRIAAIQVLANGAFLASFTYISIFADELGLSRFHITIVASLYSLAGFSSVYLFGKLADQYGKRKVLRIGLALASGLVLFQAVSWNMPSLAILRLLSGIGFGMFPAPLAAYAFEAKARMGRFSAFGALGWGISLLASGWVADTFGVASVFVLSSILLLLSFLLSGSLGPIPEVKIRSPLLPIRMVMKNREVLIPLIMRHATASSIWILWPLFLNERLDLNLAQIGMVQATNAFTQFIVMFTIGDRLKPKVSIGIGLFVTMLAVFSFTIIDTFPLFLMTQILLGISWGTLFVGTLRYMLTKNPERATAAGLHNSSVQFSSLLAPFISMTIVAMIPSSSYEGPMYLTVVFSALALVLFLGGIISKKRSS